MLRPIALPGGRYVVPGNRWDLVAEVPPPPLPVSVVVPYYDGQGQLDRALAALARQTYPAGLIDVVIADDGSARPPEVPDRLPGTDGRRGAVVRLVRQEDRGFRAAAARNLGAAVATGDVLCFLDQDLVPEPDYVERLVALPALLPDALVVGRRRHAELAGWDGAAAGRWLDGAGPSPREYPEPAWLTEAYARTRNLLDADESCFRYVISAVMSCSRTLFEDVGGFDESFDEYGGEDWEFAYRAVLAGAVLAHRADAVAWHDGPDWAARGTEQERGQQKAAEARNLARLVPHPVVRPDPEADHENVDVYVVWAEAADHPQAAADAARAALDGGLDVAVYLPPDAHRLTLPHPRIRGGNPSSAVLARARYRVEVHDSTGLGADLLERALDRLQDTGAGRIEVHAAGRLRLRVTRTAAERRARRWAPVLPDADLVAELFGSARIFTRRDSPAALSARGPS